MSNPIIQVSSISKRYRLGVINRRTFGDELAYRWHQFRGRNPSDFMGKVGSRSVESGSEFWALKDVSFEVEQGEVLGLIGSNGAGKSTLLKILTRVTEPTSGKAIIRGRVGSLLEVGTGFHPELTGRENVYMNGAILGMKRREIDAKFDEIVDFSGVEMFLDTPVKRYSSGMYVRLAFAVAAHLESEVLLVDEVLAVGDAAFQKKCLGKMGEISNGGRTILFVSHNMSAIENLCSRAVWFQDGRVVSMGACAEIIHSYLSAKGSIMEQVPLCDRKDRQGTGRVKAVNFYVTDLDGNKVSKLQSGGSYQFCLTCRTAHGEDPPLNVISSIGLSDPSGKTVWLARSNFTNQNQNLSPGDTVLVCTVRDFNLAEGAYKVDLFLSQDETEVFDWVSSAADIVVAGGDYFGTGSKGLPANCATLTRSEWSSKSCEF